MPTDCGAPVQPTNGNISFINTTYGATANVSCYHGYALNGSETINCLPSGNWSSKEYSCKLIGMFWICMLVLSCSGLAFFLSPPPLLPHPQLKSISNGRLDNICDCYIIRYKPSQILKLRYSAPNYVRFLQEFNIIFDPLPLNYFYF